MEERKLQFGDVQETALIPLSNRATETLRRIIGLVSMKINNRIAIFEW
ncbi:MAG: hypothetical protein LUI06_08140 [Ruminococcus sp.]|nr:hypothetical protein [Ruminococcus sp.]